MLSCWVSHRSSRSQRLSVRWCANIHRWEQLSIRGASRHLHCPPDRGRDPWPPLQETPRASARLCLVCTNDVEIAKNNLVYKFLKMLNFLFQHRSIKKTAERSKGTWLPGAADLRPVRPVEWKNYRQKELKLVDEVVGRWRLLYCVSVCLRWSCVNLRL